MEKPLYRKKSLERITSPESLSDYLHVTGPAIWLVLAAAILLLAGMLAWSAVASIDSIASGTAIVEDGNMRIYFDNEQIARNVESGMTVTVGETESRISSVGIDRDGDPFASASTTLPDGYYPVKIIFRQTQVLRLLFN